MKNNSQSPTYFGDEPKKIININLDHMADISYSGIRRAYVFMGLGINAADNPALDDFGLTHLTNIQIVPPTRDPATIAEYKSSFKQWVVACGIREVSEAFAIFLDAIYRAALWVEHSNTWIDDDTIASIDKSCNRLERDGLANKLARLGKIGITCEPSEELVSVWQARNCLAHRRGNVRDKDKNSRDGHSLGLEIKWRGFNSVAIATDGRQYSVNKVIKTPDGLAGGHVNVVVAIKKKFFEVGRTIDLSPQDLAEICLTFSIATDQIVSGFREYAKNKSVDVIHQDSQ